ncbi:MAG: hypothetical protein KGQ59_09515 [Bdellovibrionales bacterium]|nr:hypothetical protein [Bdellovibrionales bacterium]
MPPFHLLEQYQLAFHEGISRSITFEAHHNERQLSENELRKRSRFIPCTRIPFGMKDLPLKSITSFWNQFHDDPKEVELSQESFQKQLLTRWMDYCWTDIPTRVQIIATACYISSSDQFISLVIPENRLPESEIRSLLEGLRNLAELKGLSVILISKIRDLEKLLPNISFNGFQEQTEHSSESEDDDDSPELD